MLAQSCPTAQLQLVSNTVSFHVRRSRRWRRRRSSAGFVVLACSGALLAALKHQVLPRAAVAFPEGVERVRPNHTKVTLGPFEVNAYMQDNAHWKIGVAEIGQTSKPTIVASNLDGGAVTKFSVNFDSAQSKLPLPSSLKRLALTAHGDDSNLSATDWSVDLEGDTGQHFSMIDRDGQLAYEASAGVELPVKGGHVWYALDVKKRFNEDKGRMNLNPDWLQQGLALDLTDEIRSLKLSAHQAELKGEQITAREALANTEFKAEYKLTPKGLRGLPEGMLFARLKDSTSELGGVFGMSSRTGVKGAVEFFLKDGIPTLRGRGNLDVKKALGKGLTVMATGGLGVVPHRDALSITELQPMRLGATANLTRMLSFAAAGSEANLATEFKPGASTPSSVDVAVRLSTNAKAPISGQLTASGHVDAEGAASGSVSASGTAADLKLRYEGDLATRNQFGEVSYMAPPHVVNAVSSLLGIPSLPMKGDKGKRRDGSRVTGFGRAIQRDGGKPRLQLGVNYDFKGGVVRASGEEILYDTGGESLQSGS